MRIALIGQKWIGTQVLEAIGGSATVQIVAAPDADDRLASAAARAGIETFIYGGRGLRDFSLPERIDLLITAGSFAYVPPAVRAGAAWSIGYHPSLLPLYRGPRAVEDAINAGESVTGGTVYHLTDEMDAGGVVFQDWCFIGKADTPADLWRRCLAPMGVELITRAADHLSGYGFLPATEQRSGV
ncbi:formyltransferase family protein [Rhizobium sp. P007]|uniref:formyltransferase family protein n=1 Tax=Rhizobium sp. P007 TaxID=285908 RepID=UPI0011577992|nr:formyltransferase family protein [Rhizobium sp. P007]CAD7057700.1 methionyl-tRNA formyltransferase [Rhizobium sp. P007]